MKVAAIGMVSGFDMVQNLANAKRLITQAAQEGAEFIVLPENFAVFGQKEMSSYGKSELTPAGPLRSFLSQQAKTHGVWIAGGTIPTAEPLKSSQSVLSPETKVDSQKDGTTDLVTDRDDRVYAACFLINDQGLEVGRYDKVHLFDVDVSDEQGRYRESDCFKHGQRPLVVDTPWGRVGVAVCYDIRFPEYFRLLADLGAELVIIPSAFTYVTGEAHWEILLRARAIENLFFTLGACQGGTHGRRKQTWGQSAIINPWGVMLGSHQQGEGFVIADIDLTEVDKIRQSMPVHQHRRYQVIPVSE